MLRHEEAIFKLLLPAGVPVWSRETARPAASGYTLASTHRRRRIQRSTPCRGRGGTSVATQHVNAPLLIPVHPVHPCIHPSTRLFARFYQWPLSFHIHTVSRAHRGRATTAGHPNRPDDYCLMLLFAAQVASRTLVKRRAKSRPIPPPRPSVGRRRPRSSDAGPPAAVPHRGDGLLASPRVEGGNGCVDLPRCRDCEFVLGGAPNCAHSRLVSMSLLLTSWHELPWTGATTMETRWTACRASPDSSSTKHSLSNSLHPTVARRSLWMK